MSSEAKLLQENYLSDYDNRYTYLLKGKTVDYFLRMTKGKVKKIELRIHTWEITKEEAIEEAKLYNVFGEDLDVNELCKHRNRILGIFVDGICINRSRIDLLELIKSLNANDEFFVFTCSCGVLKCTGINNGILVFSDDKHVVWKAYSARTSRIYIFDKDQYYNAVLVGIANFLEKYKRITNKDSISVYISDIEKLEAELKINRKGLKNEKPR